MISVTIAAIASLAMSFSRPVEECLPEHPALSYLDGRPELIDSASASRLTGLPLDKLDRALAENGAVLSSDWRLIGPAKTAGRYQALRILPQRPIERISFAGLEDPVWDKLPGQEVKTRLEIVRDGPWVVNVITERIDRASGRVVWAETLSHMVGTGLFDTVHGPHIVAAIRCPMGQSDTGDKGDKSVRAASPRWEIKKFDVIISGCEAAPIEVGFGPLVDCSPLYRGETKARTEAIFEFAQMEIFRNVDRGLRAYRMALELLDARTLAEAPPLNHYWWTYGNALKRAVDEGRRVDVWEGVNSFENAIATSRSGDWGKSDHARLLGSFHMSVAEKSTATDTKRRHLDLAIAAFERALKLHAANETAKTMLEQASAARRDLK